MLIRCIVLILLLAVCSYGADSVVTIAESGGDYTSAKAAFDAHNGFDVTALDPGELLVFEFTGSWTNVDSAGIPNLICTTDPDNHVRLLGVGDARCTGVWSNTAYRSVSKNLNWYTALSVTADYTDIDGLQFEFHRTGAAGGGNGWAIMLDPSNKCTIRNCYIRRTPGDTLDVASRGIYLSELDDTVYIYNNLITGFNDNVSSYGISVATDSAASYIYNNTITECKMGLYIPGNYCIVAKNNIFSACSSAFEAGSPAASSDYNATDSAQFNTTWGSGNTNDSVNAVYDFTNAGGDDWTLTAEFAGVDLSEDSDLPFSTDGVGNERTIFWCRGFYEYPDPTGTATIQPLAIGTPDDWTCIGDKVEYVTDLTDNNTIDESTSDERQNFTLTDPSGITDETVDSLKLFWRARESSDNAQVGMELIYSGDTLTGTMQDLTISWVDYTDVFTTAPGGGAWDEEIVKALELEVVAGTMDVLKAAYVTKIYGIVYFSEAAAEENNRRRREEARR